MEELKQELEQLFDEMIHKIQLFKKKTYSPAFLEAYQDHRDLFSRISAAPRAPQGPMGSRRRNTDSSTATTGSR